MGSLAYTDKDTGKCMLNIITSETYDHVVIGAFAMQNFNFMFNGTQTDNFQIKAIQCQYTHPLANINKTRVDSSNAAPAFTYVNPVYLPLNSGYSTWVNFGPYADEQYLISLNNSGSFVFSELCTQDVNGVSSICSANPTRASLTWDLTVNPPDASNQEKVSNIMYDGYNMTGYKMTDNVCIFDEKQTTGGKLPFGATLCSLTNTTSFYVVDRVNGANTWNSYLPSMSGIIGLDM